ncbi:g1925 [Coccomyxa viridis]|uniref:G1925 protein n=1 Tax=Coccomyxa viridis TaxID=1274662 RepID=A0ABP1FR31_9CHLO
MPSRSLPEYLTRDKIRDRQDSPPGDDSRIHLSTKEIVREQNRRAAARFRQRQKDKLRDYEKQIQELTSRLSVVERERSSYELKCGEMEKVVRERMQTMSIQKPVETDNEVAKREALVEALTTFCNVVRKTRRNSSEVPELLNSAGKLSMEHIIPIYRECAQELARCLSEGGDQNGTEAHFRIQEIISARRNLFHLMGWLDPQLFRRAAAMLYGGSSEASPEPYKDAGKDHWRKVVEAVNYSQQQKEGLLLAQDQLFRRMHEVLEKREVIVNTLQTNFPCAETEHKNAPLYVQACEAADDLKANLEEEYVAVRTFIVEFCKCMDYIQHAKMLVSGYPWTPDVLVITGIVRESTGSPQEDFKHDSILQQLPDSSPFKNLSHGHALA